MAIVDYTYDDFEMFKRAGVALRADYIRLQYKHIMSLVLVVEWISRRYHNRKVMGSNPIGCTPFFFPFLFIISSLVIILEIIVFQI